MKKHGTALRNTEHKMKSMDKNCEKQKTKAYNKHLKALRIEEKF